MKKNYYLFAAIVIVAATVFAVVSCNKEGEQTTMSNDNNSYVVPQPDDMNAYLESFKDRMNSATRDDGEYMTLEDAAWHLSSVANYDFGQMNATYNDIEFDTILLQTRVSNGKVNLLDMASLYADMSHAIESLYLSKGLDNMHFRFIGTSIAEDGTVTVPLIITFENRYHMWWIADTAYCNQYFDPYTAYGAATTGLSLLQYLLNLIESCSTDPSGREYAVYSRTENPMFYNYIDPYESPNYLNSRIFVTKTSSNEWLYSSEMCYYLQSYHQLGISLL